MQCKATARNGEQCRRPSMKGGKVCASHGGKSPQAKAAAARRTAEVKAAQSMALFAEAVDIDPAQALLELVQWTAGEVRYWRAEVHRISEDSPDTLTWGRTQTVEGVGPQGPVDTETREAVAPVAYRMLTDAQDRLAKYAAAALKAGVQERQIKLAEDQGNLVAQVIRAILDQLDLTLEQQARVPEIVPTQLRLLTAA
ncbi:MAG: hypothetical protein L0G94_10665 [Brachybacterium sp.]|uniref:HGGxSTG domain-containing protein n=1 Tax=Brachybacterium sp. TaxID=1891286 RepID=UPI002649F92B|nr:HGGxSTG domain-containing protein [Brachybacterium sp.]MDN5687118.1 hypothetical protein [Brachybacterium sp.]